MLLQFYEDGTFGYKGVDDCWNENLKQVDHGKILFEQNKDEDREDFFDRIDRKPNNNEYGKNEKLDVKINDEDYKVRQAVAEQGYGLDKLVNDKDWEVRAAVARQGYRLDKLINDEYLLVRKAVLNYIKQENIPLNDILVVNDDFNNEYFVDFLEDDDNYVFFNKYFEQFIKKLPQMKRDEYFDKIISLCDDYNTSEFKSNEIKEVLEHLKK